jgi:hypothetical protein
MMPTHLLMGSCHYKHYFFKEAFMYEDIFAQIRNEAEKRNLKETTINAYCKSVGYFLRIVSVVVQNNKKREVVPCLLA